MVAPMRTRFNLLPVLLACGCASAAAPATKVPECPSSESAVEPVAPPAAEASTKLVLPKAVASFQQLLARLEKRECDAIYASFNDNMQKALGPDKTKKICTDLSKLAPFQSFSLTKSSRTTSEFEVTHESGKLEASLTLDDAGKIGGLWFRPAAPPPAPVAESKTLLRLPFEGKWLVFWGGDNLTDNKHITNKNQQRAADRVVVDESGKSHAGDGKQNKDYYAYGKKVLAAADGVVVSVIDGVPENVPGVMNPYSAVGNAVIVKHSDTEFSVYAHFQPGSIRVKPKVRVKAGQVLGLCGNSGNSSEPHIHFHMQDRADLATAVGVEPIFAKVERERAGSSAEAEGYRFQKGDQIAPP